MGFTGKEVGNRSLLFPGGTTGTNGQEYPMSFIERLLGGDEDDFDYSNASQVDIEYHWQQLREQGKISKEEYCSRLFNAGFLTEEDCRVMCANNSYCCGPCPGDQ